MTPTPIHVAVESDLPGMQEMLPSEPAAESTEVAVRVRFPARSVL